MILLKASALDANHDRHAQCGSSRAGAATSLPYMRSDAAPLTTSVVAVTS
jgi:hypothetical protein